ncbi:Hypothetical protein NTJ_05248 [Nesidiocoris tenuis]|uniref:Uncharacterized protein n=1 Tax=Nesidiocoris tenuis TaxID=355587 RepID=A0ABN7APW3_9HEMI|nr:Hypothetical protein NTJ_05248 [Nesidiocoris tenuis]
MFSKRRNKWNVGLQYFTHFTVCQASRRRPFGRTGSALGLLIWADRYRRRAGDGGGTDCDLSVFRPRQRKGAATGKSRLFLSNSSPSLARFPLRSAGFTRSSISFMTFRVTAVESQIQ